MQSVLSLKRAVFLQPVWIPRVLELRVHSHKNVDTAPSTEQVARIAATQTYLSHYIIEVRST